MGSQQQSWMFAEDQFGRRLKYEREQRGMTQADVARVLEQEHNLKLHPTAIAKMEQRGSDKPRAIRLFEARAIADMFGLTVDEMMSTANAELEELAREFAQLGRSAELLHVHTDDLFARLRGMSGIMNVPADQVSPDLQGYRTRIINALAALYQTDEARRVSAETLLDEVESTNSLLRDESALNAATVMAVSAARSGEPSDSPDPADVALFDEEEPPGQHASTVGQRLRMARLEAKLSLGQLEQRTRIRSGIIAAIESDEFSVMPKAGRHQFARGHIRTLARALQLDPASLVDQYNVQAGQDRE